MIIIIIKILRKKKTEKNNGGVFKRVEKDKWTRKTRSAWNPSSIYGTTRKQNIYLFYVMIAVNEGMNIKYYLMK